jgi:DNA topoisomerase-1
MTAEDKLALAMAHAREAGLRYVYDADPGIHRRRAGKGFAFYGPDKRAIKDKTVVARCRKLAVPPAWEDVWICRHENGHIQATGFDARGRKQYRYHEDWRATRDENKFQNMLVFGRALPALRRKVTAALDLPCLPPDRVIAAVVRLLDKTGLRVGNDAYTQENNTFGLTTIRKKHLDVHGTDIELSFVAKGGKPWHGKISDAKAAKVLSKVEDLPGQRLFKYLGDDGAPRDIESADINAWLQAQTGASITAKDFRTWNACTLFLAEAMAQTKCADGAPLQLKPILKTVSAALGNTPAILQKSYVHPQLIDLYRTGCFLNKEWQSDIPIPAGLRKHEALLLQWLERTYDVPDARAA